MVNMKRIFKCTGKIVVGLFGCITAMLFLFSVFETSKISISEVVSYHRDFPVIHLLFLAGICAAFTFCSAGGFKMRKGTLYGIFLAFMLLWVWMTRLYPKADQFIIMDRCKNIAGKNYQDFLPGGYLYNQPHQIFLAYFSTMLYSIFGEKYVFVFQGLNCLAVLGIYEVLSKFYRRLSAKCSGNLFLVLSFLFFPLLFYVTFVYGTLIGLFFALGAVENCITYLEKGNVRHILSAVSLILLARLFKTNYLIFFLGIVFVLLYDFVLCGKKAHIAFVCGLLCSMVLCNYSITVFTEKLTGIHSKGGMPGELFVMMGLSERESGPGWWNGFHELVFMNMDFDVQESKKAAGKIIRELLEKIRKNPFYEAEFFLKKTLSQWSEPTYESLWIQQQRESAGKMAWVSDRLVKGGGRLSQIYILYCDLFQSFLYFGILLYVIFCHKKISSGELFLPVIFIGGFLFHFFWEAKGQYTLPYCVALLPYGVCGYEKLAAKLQEVLERWKGESYNKTLE